METLSHAESMKSPVVPVGVYLKLLKKIILDIMTGEKVTFGLFNVQKMDVME